RRPQHQGDRVSPGPQCEDGRSPPHSIDGAAGHPRYCRSGALYHPRWPGQAGQIGCRRTPIGMCPGKSHGCRFGACLRGHTWPSKEFPAVLLGNPPIFSPHAYPYARFCRPEHPGQIEKFRFSTTGQELKETIMGSARVLSPQPQWVDSLHGYVKPYWDELLQGEWAEGVACTRLSISEMRGWILQIYPFIHAFPKFLAEALIKVEDDDSRSFLIDNIRVEKAHAEHWIWMGMGFGLKKQDMLDLAEGNRPVLRDVQSLTDWLWFINTKGSLAEAVGATSFAIEGVAGDIARKVTAGFEAYRGQPGVEMGPKTYKWFREHAHYDDEHPKIALEIVKRY